MPKPETRAWWDDVQHLREPLERKREKETRRGLRLDARAAARAVAERHASDPVGSDAGLDDVDVPPAGRRFERAAPERRGRFTRGDSPRRDAHATAGHQATGTAAVAQAVAAPLEAPAPLPAPRRRRTVEITGRTVGAPALPRLVEIDRRRPARRPAERVGARPDRLALWAVVLGFFLIFVAVTSTSHAATSAHVAGTSAKKALHQQVVRTHTAALRATPPAR
jgi:hypothetical protein